jgi:hypothetical protein
LEKVRVFYLADDFFDAFPQIGVRSFTGESDLPVEFALSDGATPATQRDRNSTSANSLRAFETKALVSNRMTITGDVCDARATQWTIDPTHSGFPPRTGVW